MRELPVLLSELEDAGAVNVRRRAARLDGTVDVTWDDPETSLASDDSGRGDLRAWIPVYILSCGIALAVIVAWALVALLGSV